MGPWPSPCYCEESFSCPAHSLPGCRLHKRTWQADQSPPFLASRAAAERPCPPPLLVPYQVPALCRRVAGPAGRAARRRLAAPQPGRGARGPLQARRHAAGPLPLRAAARRSGRGYLRAGPLDRMRRATSLGLGLFWRERSRRQQVGRPVSGQERQRAAVVRHWPSRAPCPPHLIGERRPAGPRVSVRLPSCLLAQEPAELVWRGSSAIFFVTYLSPNPSLPAHSIFPSRLLILKMALLRQCLLRVVD